MYINVTQHDERGPNLKKILTQKRNMGFGSGNRKFWPNFFDLELAKMKILLCNWHMAIKTYFMNFFHLLLKNLTSQSKCLEKRRFCEFTM